MWKAALAGLVALLGLLAACAPSQEAADKDAHQWTNGPGGVRYIDMGDGTRCYQYSANTLSCLRVNP